MKVQNLLYQPLELDFGEKVVRFGTREIGTVENKYEEHPVFVRNSKDLKVIAQPKKEKDKGNDKGKDE